MITEHFFTNGGSVHIGFKDDNFGNCSLQKRSVVDNNCIWFGRNTVAGRMVLTQEQVAELIPLLQHFVDTGDLPEPTDEEEGELE